MSRNGKKHTANRPAVGIITLVAFAALGCGTTDPVSSPPPDSSSSEADEGGSSDHATTALELDLGAPVEGYVRVDVTRTGDILVAKLVDRRLDDSAGDLGNDFLRLARDAEAKKIILDFGSVEFFSDTPLEKLMAMKMEVDSQGKQLRLCSLRGDVGKVFEIMHFDKVFTIDPDVNAALNAVR